jgi:glucokinase
MSTAPWLLADVGGTNIRFALTGRDAAGQRAGRLIMPHHFACADYSDLAEAIIAYLTRTGARPQGACVAVAGPVIGDRVSLTNSAWSFSIADTARRFGLAPLLVVNDFQALAHALPLLGPDDVTAIGPPTGVARAAKAALGPGTGFGVAGLVPDGAHWIAVTSEGGHMSFAPSDEREEEVIAYLRPRFGGRVSLDRLLCGSGLVAIFEALSALAGQDAVLSGAAEITARGLAGSCPTSRATLEFFCAALGSVAGDLALVFAALGGVYLGGGIAPRLLPILANGTFRQRFEAKGREAALVAGIPSYVITRETATLSGAAQIMAQHRG